MTSPQPPAPQITKGFIRAFGAIELLGGAAAFYFGSNSYLDGLIPVRWVAVFFMAFGAFMELNPNRFLKRAEPFQGSGNPVSNKQERA